MFRVAISPGFVFINKKTIQIQISLLNFIIIFKNYIFPN